MNQIFEYLIRPYQDLNILEVILEIFAVILGLTSVWFAKKDKVLVYPTGMLSTSIFVYLLFKAGLLGDMLINAYFFIVSIYGWYFWSKKKDGQILNSILNFLVSNNNATGRIAKKPTKNLTALNVKGPISSIPVS